LLGVQVKEPSVSPSAMTSTVFRLPLGPSFRVMVTGPEAPDQVMVKGTPALNEYSLLVKIAAFTRAAAARTTEARENFILAILAGLSRRLRD